MELNDREILHQMLANKAKINDELNAHYSSIRAIEEKLREMRGPQLQYFRQRIADVDTKIEAKRAKIEADEKAAAIKAKEQSQDDFMREIAEEIKSLVGDWSTLKKARDYQHQDVLMTYAAFKNGKNGFLNADDMGAGKTMIAIICMRILSAHIQKTEGRFPNMLWLTKKSLIGEPGITGPTQAEIKKWWPELKVFTPKDAKKLAEREWSLEIYEMMDGLYMANYEFVRSTPKVFNYKWDFVIIDEVHKLKGGANPSGPTDIWKACKDLLIHTKFNLMLTGTPMVNSPDEMWSYLHIFSPERFPSLKQFRKDFCDYKFMAGEWKLEVNPIKILENALRGQMVRRSREEFGIQLPKMDYQVIEMGMLPAQRELYRQMKEQFFVWLDSQNTDSINATVIIAQLMRLRQIALWPPSIKVERVTSKSNPLVELMNPTELKAELIEAGMPDDYVAIEKSVAVFEGIKIDEAMDRIEMVTSIPNPQSTDDNPVTEQIVVFCTMNEPLREIQRRCDARNITCEVISGQSTSREKGRNLETEFQEGKIQVLCLNSAMGEGLNLQKNPEYWIGGASFGILLDKWWSPARNNQCIGRIHRQGSDIPVTFWEFQIPHSVDIFIDGLNAEKEAKFGSIMESDVIRPKDEWKRYLKEIL